MEHTTALYELLDGTLEPVSEEALFRELAVNEDLRMEFRQISAMRGAVQSDAAAFIPPAESTVAIFKRLGFIAPAAAPAAAGILAKFASAAGTYSQAIIGGLTMTAITAATFLFVLPRFSGGETAPLLASGSAREMNVAQSPAPIETAYPSLLNTADNAPASPAQIREVVRYIYRDRTDAAPSASENTPKTEATFAETDVPATISDVPSNRLPLLAAGSGGALPSGRGDLPAAQISRLAEIAPASNLLSEFEFGFRRIDARPVGRPTVADVSQPFGNNLALAVMYRFSDELHFGAEAAREEFFQQFDVSETVRDTTYLRHYEQNPSLWSFGVAARYFPATWGDFSPYVQAGAGVSAIGPVGRFGAGLRYSPGSFLSFALQFDASALRYSEQGAAYFSAKYGLSYGVNFSF